LEDLDMSKVVRFIVSDWAWVNCVVDKAPNGSMGLPWGYAVVESDDCLRIYRTLHGEKVKETDKAVNVKYRPIRFDSRCNMTACFDWFCWLPKKCIIPHDAEKVTYFDGGQGYQVEMWCQHFANGRKVIGAWWDR
jgi:hypothetical protein